MPGPKSISLLPWQECGECSEARFSPTQRAPRDAESNRQRFYRNKFGNSSDSLENHALVSDKGQCPWPSRPWNAAMTSADVPSSMVLCRRMGSSGR